MIIDYSQMILLFCVALLSTLSSAEHKLKIIKPDILADKFKDKHITLLASSIGYTPRDSTITGLLNLANPYDGCSQLTPRPHPNIKNNSQAYQPFLHEFLMLSQGECANSIKASNVYAMGGYAAIIQRGKNTQIQKHGSKVNIPVLQITESDATVIKSFQNEFPHAYILVSLEFQKNKRGSRTEVDVWLSSTDLLAYQLLNNISSFYLQQSDRIVVKPWYYVQAKSNGEETGAMHVGCLSSGRYCAPELQYQTRLEGKQVVEEDLRQIVLLKFFGDKYWEYIKYYAAECLTDTNLFMTFDKVKKCSDRCLLRAGVNPPEVQEIYLRSFNGVSPEINQNDYLLQQRQQLIIQKIDSHPSLLINKQPTKLKQPFDSTTLQYQLCRRQTPNYSPICSSFSSDFQPTFTNKTAWTVLITVSVLATFMGLSMLIYKCVMRRRMKREISSEVFRTLEQYYTYSKVYAEGKERDGLRETQGLKEEEKREVRDIKEREVEMQKL